MLLPLWVLTRFFNFKLTGTKPLSKHLSKNLQWFLKLMTLPSIFSQFLYIGVVFFPYFCSINFTRPLILLYYSICKDSLIQNWFKIFLLTSFCSQTWLLLLVCQGKFFPCNLGNCNILYNIPNN